jgi:hypothetical protein
LSSDRKINSNRANARASTGPQTAHGRARAARNALRHGLSLPVCSNPRLSEEVEALARQIAGPEASAKSLELVRRVAEAQIDLGRVRRARLQLLSQSLTDPYYDSRENMRKKAKVRVLGGEVPDMTPAGMRKYVTSTPEGPRKLATILTQEARQLLAMDRYERRAVLRRKIAIRAYDEARR